MSDIDLAVTRSQRLEQRLERDFGASGKGLHQKVSSVESELPADLVRKLRLVATVRNKVVHESVRMDDRPRFVDAADEAERELTAIVKRRGRGPGGSRGKRWLLVLIVLIVIIAAAIKLLW
ncbi:MAG: hypothetical protein QOE14_2984 [Humisphaera sp.]|nr:hypothetical protein [Humisphaera sp.]